MFSNLPCPARHWQQAAGPCSMGKCSAVAPLCHVPTTSTEGLQLMTSLLLSSVRQHPQSATCTKRQVLTSAVKQGKAQRASQQQNQNSSSSSSCPCGSLLPYEACCQKFHQGAWARTAPEVARARVSARILGLEEFLVDSTHPENLAMIGGKQSCRRRLAAEVKRYQQVRPVVLDMCHGPGQDEGTWVVVYALRLDIDGVEEPIIDIHGDFYVQHEGRWLLLDNKPPIPNDEPFIEFFNKYGDRENRTDEPSIGFRFTWRMQAPQDPAADWYVDEWPAGSGWLYADDLGTEPGLTLASSATADTYQMLEDEALRDLCSQEFRKPTLNYETWYFRHGRFRYS